MTFIVLGLALVVLVLWSSVSFLFMEEVPESHETCSENWASFDFG